MQGGKRRRKGNAVCKVCKEDGVEGGECKMESGMGEVQGGGCKEESARRRAQGAERKEGSARS